MSKNASRSSSQSVRLRLGRRGRVSCLFESWITFRVRLLDKHWRPRFSVFYSNEICTKDEFHNNHSNFDLFSKWDYSNFIELYWWAVQVLLVQWPPVKGRRRRDIDGSLVVTSRPTLTTETAGSAAISDNFEQFLGHLDLDEDGLTVLHNKCNAIDFYLLFNTVEYSSMCLNCSSLTSVLFLVYFALLRGNFDCCCTLFSHFQLLRSISVLYNYCSASLEMLQTTLPLWYTAVHSRYPLPMSPYQLSGYNRFLLANRYNYHPSAIYLTLLLSISTQTHWLYFLMLLLTPDWQPFSSSELYIFWRQREPPP